MQLRIQFRRHISSVFFPTIRNTSVRVRSISKYTGSDIALSRGLRAVPPILKRSSIAAKCSLGGVESTFPQNFSHAVGGAGAATQGRCKEVSTSAADRTVNVKWKNGEVTSFPYVFLRDNCLCPHCFIPPSRHRIFLLRDLDLDTKPFDVKISEYDDSVHITWEDGHKSVYPADWLTDHIFSEENRTRRTKLLGVKPEFHLWGAEMQNTIPTFDFTQLMDDDRVLYKWIFSMQKYGLTLIKDAPSKPGQIKKIGERVPYLKQTHYGTIYDVNVKHDPTSIAYTDVYLCLHTDLPYTEHPAGVQMLHCIEQDVSGGENMFVDGFFVAEKLKKVDRWAYDWLTTMHIDQEDIGQDVIPFNFVSRQNLIQLDNAGQVKRVNFMNFKRSSHQDVPLEMVQPMYPALKAFDDAICDPQNYIVHKSVPGDIIFVNNHRVMHGREDFKLNEGGGRYVQGAYMDWDQLMIKFRLLGSQLENPLEILY